MNSLKSNSLHTFLLVLFVVSQSHAWSFKDLFKSKQIETPQYEVLSKNGDMEIRKYPATKWVGASFKVIIINHLKIENSLVFQS